MTVLYNRFLYLWSLFFLLCAAGVKAQVTANFSATPLSGCAPLLVQFTDQSTGNPTSWSWNLGNGTTPVVKNPSTIYTTPGVYPVTLTVSNGTSTNTKTVSTYITVYGLPDVNFSTTDTVGCPGLNVQFTNTSQPNVPGAATYLWNFGDGYSSTANSPAHIYQNGGYYNVTLLVSNSQGCTKTLTKSQYVHILQPPDGNFTATNTTICSAPGTTTFSYTATGAGPFLAEWNFGDGQGSTANGPTHTYTNPGTYTVRLILTDIKGCKDTILKNNYINVVNYTPDFSMVTSACVGTSVTFTNTSIPLATTSSWNFGDNTSNTGNTTSHTYTTPGTYTVTLNSTSAPCVGTTTKTITILPKPTMTFSGTPLPPCPAPATVQFTGPAGATAYSWRFGDGTFGTGANPSHIYGSAGNYNVTLIATSTDGCIDSLTKPSYVQISNFDVDINVSPFLGQCRPATFAFNGIVSFNSPITSYSWSFGDGQFGSTPNPSHLYPDSGTYTVILTVTAANGCTQTDSTHVHVGTKPTAGFTATPTTVCVNQPVYFNNTSVNATDYNWFFGDGSSSEATSAVKTYTDTGYFKIILIAENNGCRDTLEVDSMIHVLVPKSVMEEFYSCDTPTKVRFVNKSLGANSVTWYFGDGTTSTQSNPEHIYPALGDYNLKLASYNSATGCTDTLRYLISLFNPSIAFSANDTAVCRGDSVIFTSAVTGGHIQEYNWYIGTFPLLDTSASVKFTFTSPGYTTVTLNTKDEHGCLDTAVRNNYILTSQPVAGFYASPLIGCLPFTTTLFDTSKTTPGATIVTRQWTYGDGTGGTVTTASVPHTYNALGLYDIKLKVTDNVGCTDSLVKVAYVEARKPVAAFTAQYLIACAHQQIGFFNTSTGTALSYKWYFGDGTDGIGATPSHAYANSGVYTVKLVVTDATGCKDSLIRTNYITVNKPTAGFTMSDSVKVCPPLTVNFTNTSVGAVSYSWDFDNGSTSNQANPSNILFTTPGAHNVRLIVTSSQGCKDTIYHAVRIMGYTGAFTYTPTNGCRPLEVKFDATIQNVSTFVWDFSDGNTLTTSTPQASHIYTVPGSYVPKLILSDGAGCIASSTGADTIKVDGILPGFTVTSPCEYDTARFLDTSKSFFSAVTTTEWYFDNGQTSTLHNPTHPYGPKGQYPVKLVVTNANGCKDSLVQNVNILPPPTISAGKDTVICLGDAAQLQASGGVSYTWTPPNALSCSNCGNPQASPNSNMNFIVTGTDQFGCKNKDTVNVGIKTKTEATASPNGEICEQQHYQLLASGAQKYEWSPVTGLDNPNIANPKASPDTTIDYMVIASEGSCEPDTAFVTVTVHPKPEVNAGPDHNIVAGETVTLTPTGTHLETLIWTPSEGLSCTKCNTTLASPGVTTTYTVTAVTQYGCSDTDDVTIRVVCDNKQVFIPNTFSPNGDGQNDVFYPRGKGLDRIVSFRIFNRWGELVYERNNIGLNDASNGWDGTFKGQVLTPDVFVYTVEALCTTGETINWKGDVSLIR
jgi:gliding motility-associated-like protein